MTIMKLQDLKWLLTENNCSGHDERCTVRVMGLGIQCSLLLSIQSPCFVSRLIGLPLSRLLVTLLRKCLGGRPIFPEPQQFLITSFVINQRS
jgi:hypothetical protein